MAEKTKQELRDYADANLNTNGVKGITGASVNTMWNDAIDSFATQSEVDEISTPPSIETVSTSTYTVTGSNFISYDIILHVTRTATGTCTITINSDVISEDSFRIYIKDTGNANTYNITIETQGSETIDGDSNLVITGDYEAVSLYSNGSNLFIY